VLQHRKNDLQAVLRLPIPVRALAYTVMFYGLVLYEPGSEVSWRGGCGSYASAA
jgi:hypothetical protein